MAGRRLAAAAVGALLLALLAGCGGSSACPTTNAHGRAESSGTEDIRVLLDDGQPAVLHLAKAKVYRASGDRCAAATSSAIYTGAPLDFHVDAWAESYPQQGWPTVLVVR